MLISTYSQHLQRSMNQPDIVVNHACFIDEILTQTGVQNPARGHNVESTIRRENVQRTLHNTRKGRQWYMIVGKRDISIGKKKHKDNC